jgi:YegS/Rv2252/BmrU family lipid kinase
MTAKNKYLHIKLISDPRNEEPSDAANNLKLVKDYLKKNGLKADLDLVKSRKEATKSAKRAIKAGYKIVVAMGSDGTVQSVMRGMIGSKARLGILPIGSKNNVAMSLGIPEDLNEACALITTGHVRKLDLGQVKTRKGRKHVFFEMATIGLLNAIYPTANKTATGKLSKSKNVVTTTTLQETKPKVVLTLSDKSHIEVETMLVMVSNTPVFGKSFKVAPDASLNDGLLDISVYPNFGKVELLRYSAAVMNGGYSGEGKVQHYQSSKLKIKTSPKLDVMADGVALGRGKVSIKVLPGALRILTTQENPVLETPKKEKAVVQPKSVPPTMDKPVSKKV